MRQFTPSKAKLRDRINKRLPKGLSAFTSETQFIFLLTNRYPGSLWTNSSGLHPTPKAWRASTAQPSSLFVDHSGMRSSVCTLRSDRDHLDHRPAEGFLVGGVSWMQILELFTHRRIRLLFLADQRWFWDMRWINRSRNKTVMYTVRSSPRVTSSPKPV